MSVDEKQSEGVGGGVAVTSIHGNIPYNSAVIHNKGGEGMPVCGKVVTVCLRSECKSNESFPAVDVASMYECINQMETI